jgi:acyl dehydratase
MFPTPGYLQLVRVFATPDDLRGAVGEHLGYSDWLLITQAQVTAFADATGDHQWIHVDPERAATGPYGATIAHGYLMLSLLPRLCAEVYRVDGVALAVNYGLNRVRFPAPVPTGSEVRAGLRVVAVNETPGGVGVTCEATVEVRGAPKPSCVAETVTRLYFPTP